ncbi:MAG TPA: hypothetical protein DIW34_02050 [Oribacterium sp.]|nr:hypothetical protein [Oribacterium sp.]
MSGPPGWPSGPFPSPGFPSGGFPGFPFSSEGGFPLPSGGFPCAFFPSPALAEASECGLLVGSDEFPGFPFSPEGGFPFPFCGFPLLSPSGFAGGVSPEGGLPPAVEAALPDLPAVVAAVVSEAAPDWDVAARAEAL